MWPSQAADDGEELVRAYLLAVEDYPADDVTNAVDMMVKGTAPGINPGFRPKPSEVGAECRRQMTLRLEREHREKIARPRLPPPLAPRTAESKAKFKGIVEQIVANLSMVESGPNPSSEAGRRSILERTNKRFDAERYEAGDPDGDRHVA